MAREPERTARLRHNGELFLKLAQEAGLDTGLSVGYSVVPVLVGDSLRAVQLSNELLAAGVNALPIIHPAVPEGLAACASSSPASTPMRRSAKRCG